MLSTLPKRNRGAYLDKFAIAQLSTNLFKVNFKEETKVYIYSFKTQPQIPRENVHKVRTMLIQNRSIVERVVGTYVISGRTVFGSKPSKMEKGAQTDFKLQFQGKSYQVLLKMVRTVSLSDVYSPDIHKSGVVFAFLNNMLKNFFHELQYTQIGKSRKYFDSKHYKNLEGARVTIFKGYSSNFTLLESGLYMRIDPAVKIVRGDTVLEYIQSLYKLNSSLSKEEKRKAVEAALIGKMVMANYGKNKYYVIDGIEFETTLQGFTFHDGTQKVNLLQYYKTTYDLEIKNLKQPLVQVGSDRKEKQKEKEKGKENEKERDQKSMIYLVPELLLMSGLPDDFDERKRREISEETIVPPSEKAREIQSIFNRFCQSSQSFNPNVVAQKLGIAFETKPAKISGKQLNLPELQLGSKQRIEEHKSTNFMLFNKPLFSTSVTLKITMFHPSDFDSQPAKNLLSSTCASLKLEYKLVCKQVRFQETRGALKTMQKMIEESSNSTNLFWFVLPPFFKNNYSSLKKLVIKTGIQKNSQVTLAPTFQKKGFASVLTKILLQMAAKVGNKLWVPKIHQKILRSGVLMIGIESYGDQNDKSMNVLSFCGTTNNQCSSFYSNYILHPKNDHSKTYMKEIVFECINQYVNSNRAAPQDVIIIKNGSSKFDHKLVVQSEVAEIKEVFQSLARKAEKVHLVYMLMDKDANQKFFVERGREAANPTSGMLVNSEAVGKGFEFYLVAQQCNRGTVKPTFYKVLYSDTYLEEGVIEQLIYTQCFNYMNWTGSIKVPSVLQYAKKMSMFVGQYIGSEKVADSLHKHLYYI